MTDGHKTATVYHNSRHTTCTIAKNQVGLRPYEVRVYIGVGGANILHINRTRKLVVHRNNVDVHTNVNGIHDIPCCP